MDNTENNIENDEQKTRRDLLLEKVKGRNPDFDSSDDEELYGKVLSDYERLEGLESNKRQLDDMISADPRAASVLVDIKNHNDPALGLVRRFGPEIRDYLDNPENQEKLAKEEAAYLERLAKEKELEDKWKANIGESMKALEEFQQEKGLSDDEADALLEKAVGIGNDMVVGIFTKETFDMVHKGGKYDADVEEAAAAAEIRGRNAKIEERLRKPQAGDGLPSLAGAPAKSSRDDDRALGAIGSMGSPSIWERGNAKRIKH